MPTCANSFGTLTKQKQEQEIEYYKNYSQNISRSKDFTTLVQREEAFMKKLRNERRTKGFSEGFPERRKFPKDAVPADD